MLEKYRPTMDKDVLHSWAIDAQARIEQLETELADSEYMRKALVAECLDQFKIIHGREFGQKRAADQTPDRKPLLSDMADALLSDMADALIRELHAQGMVTMQSFFDGAKLLIYPEQPHEPLSRPAKPTETELGSAINNARLTWAMVCQCDCQGCTEFDDEIRERLQLTKKD